MEYTECIIEWDFNINLLNENEEVFCESFDILTENNLTY